MPAASFELTRLDSNTFEHLANMLAMKVLGAGHTGFSPGPDGGRDGYFEGPAPYPTAESPWSGVWYIQAKFHEQNASSNVQKWLVNQVARELEEFTKDDTRRTWPDNWIIITNVDPSGTPHSGSFDKIRKMVREKNSHLANRFDIWGGRKVLDLLATHEDVRNYYSEFITSGNVLSALYKQIVDAQADAKIILRHLIAGQFDDFKYTKLEQAGASEDHRPGIEDVFVDIPFKADRVSGMAAKELSKALSQNHRPSVIWSNEDRWNSWRLRPGRARAWIIKGGPGHGKSTLTQYISQIQRSAYIVTNSEMAATPGIRKAARSVQKSATAKGFWPLAPRVPVCIELKDFAQWLSNLSTSESPRLIKYIADTLHKGLGEPVHVGTLRRLFTAGRWLFIFDGLDEVPTDLKDVLASEVAHFSEEVLVECDSDAALVYTSRQQGYSGQFDRLDAVSVELPHLSPEQSIECASPLLKINRTEKESRHFIETLKTAMNSSSIAEIMKTPLQSHIMAVIVRGGGRPPEKKWQLFRDFYQVIKKREASRNLPDSRLATLLSNNDDLLKVLHNRVGFELHLRAELSSGADTSLSRSEFDNIIREIVEARLEHDIEKTIETLKSASTERLVLVSTPESGDKVRFEIRSLQEFFAAEYIYEDCVAAGFPDRLRAIAGDPHWQEVLHFLLSALVHLKRQNDLSDAVTILAALDDDEDPATRAFNRRLARGGSATMKLLTEGVLEQDKRLRQTFRQTLTPLLTCTDLIELVEDVRLPNTSHWLNQVLRNHVQESSHHEAFGALCSLAAPMIDNDAICPSVLSSISELQLEHKQALLIKIAYRFYDQDGNLKPSDWLAQLAFDTIKSDEWHKCDFICFDLAIRILQINHNKVRSILLASGLSEAFVDLASQLLHPVRLSFRSELKIDNTKLFEVGEAETEDALDLQGLPPRIWEDFKRSTGFLKSCGDFISFVMRPTKRTLQSLKQSLGGDIENAQMLPIYSYGFFNTDHLVEANLGATAIQTAVRPQGRAEIYTFVRTELPEDVEWDVAFKDHPARTLFALLSAEKLPSSISVKPDILNAALRYPSSRQNLFANAMAWGALFSLPNIGNIIRACTVELSKTNRVRASYYRRGHSKPFRLLDEEAELLPHIVAAVAHRSDPEISASAANGVASTLLEYVGDVGYFERVLNAEGYSKRVYAAAVLGLYLCRATQVQRLATSKFDDWYEQSESYWISSVAASCFRLSDDTSAIRAIIGEIFIKTAADIRSRIKQEVTIHNLRNISTAPVHALERHEIWNDGSSCA